MLEKITDLPAGIDGVKATGKVSKEDYDRVMEPVLSAARREGRKLRFLYEIGPEFQGFTPAAAWEDATLGFGNLRLFDAVAVVTDVKWIGESTRLAAFLMPCPVRTFSLRDRTAAIQFLETLSSRATVTTRVVPGRGVIVVEVTATLRAQDFDVISLTADTWIESHGRLDGLVIHAREFPGWENLGAFFRHVRFVRDHHRKIGRVALAADSRLAAVAPGLAEHFVKAEIKAFRYDELDAAIDWAGAGGAETT